MKTVSSLKIPGDPAVSAAVLCPPDRQDGRLVRGVMILNRVDDVLEVFPALRSTMIIIERRGWYGMNDSRLADIKLIDDPATLQMTREVFPQSISLEVSNADFVDDASFRPLGLKPTYDVIQISSWSRRKRTELLIEAAGRLRHLRFLHLGHFEADGTADELAYRDRCVRLAEDCGADLTFPFRHCDQNARLPWSKQEINEWINQAHLGVLTATMEGVNRFKLECLCADRPVLVATDAGGTTQKHINLLTGALFAPTPDHLASAITAALDRIGEFRPREYLLRHSGRTRSLALLRDALRQICTRDHSPFRYDDLDWDGRNERLKWGDDAIDLITSVLEQAAGLQITSSGGRS